MEEHTVRLPVSRPPTDAELKALRAHFGQMPLEEILAGLKFAGSRWAAKDAGVLRVGRKSIIKREVHSVTAEQARWRLKHWKMMIANYRRRGYSYPTISRIKKILVQKSGGGDGDDGRNGGGGANAAGSHGGEKGAGA